MNARMLVVSCATFAIAALLGAGFAIFGPVALIRIFGTIAFVGGAAGCALQLYALHEFAPGAYTLLIRRWRASHPGIAGMLPSAQRTVLAAYR